MDTIQYLTNNQHIGIVYLNRPPYNPLSSQVYHELFTLFEELEKDSEVRAIILTGKGDRAFAAGADINEMVNLDGADMMEMSRISRLAYDKIESISKPVIAAVNGLALGGGCELALACDFRIGSPKIGRASCREGGWIWM